MSEKVANTFDGRLIFLMLSILLNVFFNALTVSTNMGSAVWTASAVNLAHLFNLSLGNTLFLEGVIVAIVNLILLGQFDYFRLFRNLIFIVPYSYLLAWFKQFFFAMGIPFLPIGWRFVLDLVGLTGVAVAVSLYQRANVVLHPNDDLPFILRFRFLHGSPCWSQWDSNIPPIAIIVVTAILTHQLFAVNIGTILNFVMQGYIIGWADQHIFPQLHHHLDFKSTLH